MTDTAAGSAHPRSKGKLWDLLFTKFPEHRTVQGILDIKRLAVEIDRSHEALYRVIKKNQVTLEQAVKLIEISDGRISHADLKPFVNVSGVQVDDVKHFI